MWKCKKCEAEVDSNAASCPVCGEAQPEENEVENTELNSVWFCEDCKLECDDTYCPNCGKTNPDSDNDSDEATPKKSSKIYGFVIAVSVIVAITIEIFTYFIFNRYFEKTGNDNSVTYNDVISSMDGITGDEVIFKINGLEVTTSLFNSMCAESALVYQQEYCGNDISKLDNFKWTDKANNGTKNTHQEQVLENVTNNCVKIFSAISLGEEFDIQPSQLALEEIEDRIASEEKTYGDDFEKLLKLSGFESVDQYREYLTVNARYDAVLADMDVNPDRYIDKDGSIYDTKNPDRVYVLSLFLYYDESEEETKKRAEDIIKEAQTEDFKALIRKYDETDYTETKPGMMEHGLLSSQLPEMTDFENAAMALKINEVSEPIATPTGYFVLKRVAVIDDVLKHAEKEAKLIANTSVFKDIKITVDYKKVYEESLKSNDLALEDEYDLGMENLADEDISEEIPEN